MYAEFSEFRHEINTKVDNLEEKVDKNTLLLESINDKLKLLAEIQQNHFELNERQHEEMNKAHK